MVSENGRFPVDGLIRDEISEINKKIKDEMNKPDCDKHKVMRLEEQKLMQSMFSQVVNPIGRFRSPW